MHPLLVIIRHGKAARDSATGRDADRELLPRGRRQAEFLAGELAVLVRHPIVMVSSPITRARQTAEILAGALRTTPTLDDRLSTSADVDDALTVAAEAAEAGSPATVLLVGHNPTLSEALFLAAAKPQDCEQLRTGEAVVLEFNARIARRSGKLLARLRLED